MTWIEVIAELHRWLEDPSQLSDDGLDAPTRKVIVKAIALAQRLQSVAERWPVSVVPGANGGIVFERRGGADATSIHLWEDGHVERIEFVDGKVAFRAPIEIE